MGDLTRARALTGRHNWQNAAAAYAAAVALGVSPQDAATALMSFPGLAHRMEEVARIGRVRFINDSKATNADAARQAMSALPRFYWIAGGRPKDGGVETLREFFPKIAKAYLIGEAAAEFAKALKGAAPAALCGDVERAVAEAFHDAQASGEDAVVLLSPACASFDQFPDFEARGEAFRAAVLSLAEAPAEAAHA
jgi:UDP-N-acetylmuramoylalanine--D-glutamate ligase